MPTTLADYIKWGKFDGIPLADLAARFGGEFAVVALSMIAEDRIAKGADRDAVCDELAAVWSAE